MEHTSSEREVDSVDEAIAVGADELGVDESELRDEIDALSFHRESEGAEDSGTQTPRSD